MTSFIDITLPLSEKTPVWPGDNRFNRIVQTSIANGDDLNVSAVEMNCHNGTHLDAPFHSAPAGASIDELDPAMFVGPARVVAYDGETHIEPADVKKMNLEGVERVLFKTRNSSFWGDPDFHEDYVGVTAPAARVLVDLGVRLVGIDYLSVGPFDRDLLETHQTLLGHGVVVLEGLNLRDVEPGGYELIALPLKIAEGNGSPTRAILRRLD